MHVRREDVHVILSELDPEGFQFRCWQHLQRRLYFSHGPNFLWFVDSYDKLSPYGTGINSCIDGFRCKFIWFRAAHSNSDLQVIGSFYPEAITEIVEWAVPAL